MRGRVMRATALALVCLLSTACGISLSSETQPTPSDSIAPVAPADYVGVASDKHAALLGGRRFTDNGLGLLIGPHFQLRQQSVGDVREIDAGTARKLGLAGPIRAPSGSELVVADFQPAVGYQLVLPPGGHQPGSLRSTRGHRGSVQSVVVGKETRPVHENVTGGELLIVCAPVGARVLLQVADSGRTQRLDLRSGHRDGDALSSYYPDRDWGPPGPGSRDAWSDIGLISGDRSVYAQVVRLSAVFSPFAPTGAWARRGRAWVYVTVQLTTACDFGTCQVRYAPGTQIRLLVGRTPVRAVGRPIHSDSEYVPSGTAGTGTMAFEVPSTARSATVSVILAGPLTVRFVKRAKGKHAVLPRPVSWRSRPKSVDVRVGAS